MTAHLDALDSSYNWLSEHLLGQALVNDEVLQQMDDDLGWETTASLVSLFAEDAWQFISSIHEALLCDNIVLAKNFAHSLKGSAASFGAESLAQQAAFLEAICEAGDQENALSRLHQLPEILEPTLQLIDRRYSNRRHSHRKSL